jgi:hypothetical protein
LACDADKKQNTRAPALSIAEMTDNRHVKC